MNSITIYIIVEGKTEEYFVEKVLNPYLAEKNIYVIPTQIKKSGQKGGDVKFTRVKRDIISFLKQQQKTYVSTFFDFYGLKEWPELDSITKGLEPQEISNILTSAAKNEIAREFQGGNERFIPFLAIHEFETLLFSDAKILADYLDINEENILNILKECGEPEAINNSKETAPSKRIDKLKNNKFKKTSDGIEIAQRIGINKIREKCPVFNSWIEQLEILSE